MADDIERSVKCVTCGARPGRPCDESKIPAYLNGYHSKRVRLALTGRSDDGDGDERQQYERAARSRGSDVSDRQGWRRR